MLTRVCAFDLVDQAFPPAGRTRCRFMDEDDVAWASSAQEEAPVGAFSVGAVRAPGALLFPLLGEGV